MLRPDCVQHQARDGIRGSQLVTGQERVSYRETHAQHAGGAGQGQGPAGRKLEEREQRPMERGPMPGPGGRDGAGPAVFLTQAAAGGKNARPRSSGPSRQRPWLADSREPPLQARTRTAPGPRRLRLAR